MKIRPVLLATALIPAITLGASHMDIEECCNIIAIDARAGTVTLEVSGSDKNVTLRIGAADLLGSMRIGDAFGIQTEDDWKSGAIPEDANLVPIGVDGLDSSYIEECCQVIAADFGVKGESRPTQRLAEGVTFEVVDVRRVNKNVLHFAFAIDNQTDEVVNPMNYGILGYVGSGPTRIANGVELHDLIGLKSYRAGTASESKDLDVAPGARREYWAQYQAPPSGVEALTVILSDAPPIYGVPIQ